MLLAASESAVTKKPRLRLTRRRSSSVRPFGFFHSSISRCMLTSCGIQWLAQPARYLSHAHLYLNGTSWLTSVLPLMMRLSSAFTRRATCSALASDGSAPAGRFKSVLPSGACCAGRGAAADVVSSSHDNDIIFFLSMPASRRSATGPLYRTMRTLTTLNQPRSSVLTTLNFLKTVASKPDIGSSSGAVL
ncbi:hypothetical protein D3C81_529800 [compost metagenome]